MPFEISQTEALVHSVKIFGLLTATRRILNRDVEKGAQSVRVSLIVAFGANGDAG
jgi:hypothetical protein